MNEAERAAVRERIAALESLYKESLHKNAALSLWVAELEEQNRALRGQLALSVADREYISPLELN